MNGLYYINIVVSKFTTLIQIELDIVLIMTQKTSFKKRTEAQIKSLGPKLVWRERGLVNRILGLQEDEALELRFPLIPARFRTFESQSRSSQVNYKHGAYIALKQPESREEAYLTKDIPLEIRRKTFDELKSLREEDIDFMGYSFSPVQGRDRRKRVVPFVWLPEAAKIFSYAENKAGGITVKPYDDSRRVSTEGASIICDVPSRTKKKERYTVKLMSVPVDGVTERRAIAWSLKSQFEGREPEHSTYGEIRYTPQNSREGSDVFMFNPHTIAAYISATQHYYKRHNLTPMEMSPLAFISKITAEFYERLNNNILIYDPTLKDKDKRRHLHLDEKSILIARSVGRLGNDEILYWDPVRDGDMKDYFFG